MSVTVAAKGNRNRRSRSVLEMTCDDARSYFLDPRNYCSIDLPPYFQFDKLLANVSNVRSRKKLTELRKQKPRDYDNVNHSLYNNKDGKYAWRPLQIIHPAIYVALVNEVTTQANWEAICDRFRQFQANKKI